jgi:hypothetical protein
MPAILDPNLGLRYGWEVGEDGWKPGMDSNLKKLGALVMCAALSVANSPSATSDGTRYIVGTSPTGDFAGQANKLAVRVESAWQFYPASAGWAVFDLSVSRYRIFNGTTWALEKAVIDARSFLEASNPGGWTFPTATWTKVPLYTVTTDTANAWDNSASTDYVVPTAGVYQINAIVRPVRSGSGALPDSTSLAVGVGTTAADSKDVVWGAGLATALPFSLTVNRVLRCAAGDRLSLFARHAAAAAVGFTYASMTILNLSE